MSAPANATTVVVDYQRAHHQGGGRRRKTAGQRTEPSGVLDVFTAFLAIGLVLAAVYLASDDPWVKRAAPARDAGAGVAMRVNRSVGSLSRATVEGRAGGRHGIRR